MQLEAIAPPGTDGTEEKWKEAEAGLMKVAKWYEAAGSASTAGEEDVFICGGTEPTAVDIFLAARLIWVRITLGELSEGWLRIKNMDGGRWGRLMDRLRVYEGVA